VCLFSATMAPEILDLTSKRGGREAATRSPPLELRDLEAGLQVPFLPSLAAFSRRRKESRAGLNGQPPRLRRQRTFMRFHGAVQYADRPQARVVEASRPSELFKDAGPSNSARLCPCQAGRDVEGVCPLCRAPGGSPFHGVWVCPRAAEERAAIAPQTFLGGVVGGAEAGGGAIPVARVPGLVGIGFFPGGFEAKAWTPRPPTPSMWGSIFMGGSCAAKVARASAGAALGHPDSDGAARAGRVGNGAADRAAKKGADVRPRPTEALENIGLPPALCNVARCLCRRSARATKLKGQIFDMLEMASGARHGRPPSRLLFVLVIDMLPRRMQRMWPPALARAFAGDNGSIGSHPVASVLRAPEVFCLFLGGGRWKPASGMSFARRNASSPMGILARFMRDAVRILVKKDELTLEGTAAHAKKKARNAAYNARERAEKKAAALEAVVEPYTRKIARLEHRVDLVRDHRRDFWEQLQKAKDFQRGAEKERGDAIRRLCSFQTWWSVFLKLCLQDCAGGREGAGRQGRGRPQELPNTLASEVKHWSESGVSAYLFCQHFGMVGKTHFCADSSDEYALSAASAVKGTILAGTPTSLWMNKPDAFATRCFDYNLGTLKSEVGVDAHATVERWIQSFEEGVEEHMARKMDSGSSFADLLGGGPRKRPAAAKAAPKRRAKRSAKSRPAQAGVKKRPVMKRPARSRPPAARTRKVTLQVDESFLDKGELSKLAKNARGKQELLENFKELSPPAGVAVVSDKWRGAIAAVKQYRNDAGLTERMLPHKVVNHSAGEIANERGFTTNRVELQWSLVKRWIRKRYGGTLPKKADRKKWSRLLAEHRFRTHIKASGQKVSFAALAAAFQTW
ncbi:unnamed protein product, partial [Prorocentrum cordatum]